MNAFLSMLCVLYLIPPLFPPVRVSMAPLLTPPSLPPSLRRDKANSDGGLISGHVLDSTGMVIRTNLSTKNQTHESVVLYRQTRTVARAVSRDTEHLFQEMNSFTSVADDSIDNGYGDEVLEPGMHRFPFAFTVPEDAQSTCSMIRSYNGDNTACSTARLIVHADIPLGPGDKRRVALQVPVARSNSSSRKSSKKSAKQAAATLTEIASLAVHSVPLHIRSRVPPDPAAQRPAQRLSLETDPRQVNIRHVGSADDLTTPIYDQDGLPSNQVLAPIHSALEDGSDGGGKVERTSSAARDSMSLQPFVVDTRRMSCCCLPCGRSMTLQARTDSYSYCTTDTPKVEWEIITKSHKKVQNVCLELIRKCEWKAQKHDYVSELILSQVTRNCVDQGSKVGGISEFEFGGNLNLCCNVSIPLSDPNSIVCCSSISTSIFSVTYFIRVTARVYPGKGKCCSSNPVVHLPISLYSRLYTEMGLRGSGDEQAQAQGSRAFQRSGSERFLLNSGEAQLMVSATLEYIKLFRMFGGVNYSTHGADNLVPALAVPAIYDVKYGM